MKLKSNEPFWLVKNGLLHTYPSLRANINTDILVVGGGITGSLIAHQCMEDGYETVVMDRREICNGSTSATTSMLQYEIDKPLYRLIELIGEEGAVLSYKACSAAIDTLQHLVNKIHSAAGFKKKDSLFFAEKKKDIANLLKEFEARKKAGFPVSWLSQEDIVNTFGIAKTYGGILSKQGASMDAFVFAHDLLHYNAKRGLKIFDKTNLEKITYTARKAVATTEDGFEINCKKIIYCNGFESIELVKDDFVDLISTYAIVGEPQDKATNPIRDLLVWNTGNPYLYMRATDDGRILIGGGDENFRNPNKRDALISRKSKYLAHKLHTHFTWAGTFGATKDGLPYIGTHPDFPHSYFVLGFGGNGITFSVIGMEMVSAMLQKKQHALSPYFKFKR
jgi:glycine/D-amino acid oxidase-like deaminating enzyme